MTSFSELTTFIISYMRRFYYRKEEIYSRSEIDTLFILNYQSLATNDKAGLLAPLDYRKLISLPSPEVLQLAIDGKEPYLGIPSEDGLAVFSDSSGVRYFDKITPGFVVENNGIELNKKPILNLQGFNITEEPTKISVTYEQGVTPDQLSSALLGKEDLLGTPVGVGSFVLTKTAEGIQGWAKANISEGSLSLGLQISETSYDIQDAVVPVDVFDVPPSLADSSFLHRRIILRNNSESKIAEIIAVDLTSGLYIGSSVLYPKEVGTFRLDEVTNFKVQCTGELVNIKYRTVKCV